MDCDYQTISIQAAVHDACTFKWQKDIFDDVHDFVGEIISIDRDSMAIRSFATTYTKTFLYSNIHNFRLIVNTQVRKNKVHAAIFIVQNQRYTSIKQKMLAEQLVDQCFKSTDPLHVFLEKRYGNVLQFMKCVVMHAPRILYGVEQGPSYDLPEKCLLAHWSALVLQWVYAKCDPESTMNFQFHPLGEDIIDDYLKVRGPDDNSGLPMKFSREEMARLRKNCKVKISMRWIMLELMPFFHVNNGKNAKAIKRVLTDLFRIAMTYAIFASKELKGGYYVTRGKEYYVSKGTWTIGGLMYGMSKKAAKGKEKEDIVDAQRVKPWMKNIDNRNPFETGIDFRSLHLCTTLPRGSLAWATVEDYSWRAVKDLMASTSRMGWTSLAIERQRLFKESIQQRKIKIRQRGVNANRSKTYFGDTSGKYELPTGDCSILFERDSLMTMVSSYIAPCHVRYPWLFPELKKEATKIRAMASLIV